MAQLTAQRVREVTYVDEETGRLYWHPRAEDEFPRKCQWASWNKRCAGKEIGCLTRGGRKVLIDNEKYFVHHVVWFCAHGVWPENLEHRDGNFDNYKLSNLVEVSRAETMRRARISVRNKSGRTGVHQRGDKWQSVIWDGDTQINLGWFSSKALAARARERAERKYGYREGHGRPA